MKKKWSFLVMICALFCCNIAFANLDFISKLFLSNKKYAKNIEVETYLVTKDQVANLFENIETKIIQKQNKDLYGKEVYLLVRCKNTGDYAAFGTLKCKVENCNFPITIDQLDLGGYMTSYHDSLIYFGRGFVPNDNEAMKINYQWDSLYTM